MNRRSLFKFFPMAPVIGVSSLVVALKPKLAVALPKRGDMDWGETINNAIREFQEEINKR